MDLRQVEQVLAVFDHGSVTGAAKALHLAQPSVSETLRRTERELGTPLFHRVGRRLVPTPAGEAFVGPARQLLRDREGLIAGVAAIAGGLAATSTSPVCRRSPPGRWLLCSPRCATTCRRRRCGCSRPRTWPAPRGSSAPAPLSSRSASCRPRTACMPPASPAKSCSRCY